MLTESLPLFLNQPRKLGHGNQEARTDPCRIQRADCCAAGAEVLRKKEVAEVVAKIKDVIAHYGLAAGDLGLATVARMSWSRLPRSSSSAARLSSSGGQGSRLA